MRTVQLTNLHVLNHIMITCPSDLDPLTTHFYKEKLGFTGVYIIFSSLLQNIFALKHRLWVLVRTASLIPTIFVLSKNKENVIFFHLKLLIFRAFPKRCKLHANDFVMTVETDKARQDKDV